MSPTRHPLLILASGLIALLGLCFMSAAVAAQIWVLPRLKEILADFEPASHPIINDIDSLSVTLSAVILAYAIFGAVLCGAAIGVFLRHRISWRIALVVSWIMTLTSAVSVLGAFSAGSYGAALSAALAGIPFVVILCLLYLRQVRPAGMMIERTQDKPTLA